jgi:hypothetical protein
MLDKLKNALALAKDKAVEQAALGLANCYLENLGTVTHLEINSREKTLAVALALKGEPSTITARAGRYEVTEAAGEAWITFYDCSASREWITGALRRYAEGRRFKIPPQLGLAL